MKSADETSADRVVESAIVIVGTQELQAIILTGMAVALVVPPISLSPVMLEVVRLGTTVYCEAGPVVKRVKEWRVKQDCSKLFQTKFAHSMLDSGTHGLTDSIPTKNR